MDILEFQNSPTKGGHVSIEYANFMNVISYYYSINRSYVVI